LSDTGGHLALFSGTATPHVASTVDYPEAPGDDWTYAYFDVIEGKGTGGWALGNPPTPGAVNVAPYKDWVINVIKPTNLIEIWDYSYPPESRYLYDCLFLDSQMVQEWMDLGRERLFQEDFGARQMTFPAM
jgi:hypothetical protein